MAKLPTNRQARENAAFLEQLRRSGNATAAARELGISPKTFHSRRRKDAAFAAQWEAALAAAQAALAKGDTRWSADLRIQPGVAGRMQLRRPRKGTMDRAGEQRFLRALAATCNVSLAAAAAGFNGKNVHRRRKDKAFAAEWDLALRIGHERLMGIQMERVDQALGDGGADRAWLDHDDTPPPMTSGEMIQLMKLHQRAVVLGEEHRAEHRITRRVGRLGRLNIDEIVEIRRAAHEREAAERALEDRIRARLARRADHYEATGNWFLPGEAEKGRDAPDWAAAAARAAKGRKGKGVRVFTAQDAEKGRAVKARKAD